MDNITLKLEDNRELTEPDSYTYLILLNNNIIGTIDFFYGGDYLSIELMDILSEHRGKGYGTKALEILKETSKAIGIEFIRGECPRIRMNFYKRLGAKFECRDDFDLTFINNVFYIDL